MKKLIAISIVLVCSAASAEFQSSESLLQQLQSQDDKRILACGYIIGVHDLGRGSIHCTPAGTSASDVVESVTRYLAASTSNRQVMKDSADIAVSAVLKANYPCQNAML